MKIRLILYAIALGATSTTALHAQSRPLSSVEADTAIVKLSALSAAADAAVIAAAEAVRDVDAVHTSLTSSFVNAYPGSEVTGSPARATFNAVSKQFNLATTASVKAGVAYDKAVASACRVYAIVGFEGANEARKKRHASAVNYCPVFLSKER